MIGFGSPNKGGTHDVHGAPLGASEIANTRRQLEWPFAAFEIPDDVRRGWDATARGEAAEEVWAANFAAYRAAYPEAAAEFERRTRGDLPGDWHARVAAPVSYTHLSFMSRPNIIVCPGGKMGLAMQIIFTPMIMQLMDKKRRAR